MIGFGKVGKINALKAESMSGGKIQKKNSRRKRNSIFLVAFE